MAEENIYRHINNLVENGIINKFDTRTDTLNQPLSKFMLSEDMKNKNPIDLPLSFEIDK